jgi:hypothetical protein
MLLEPVERREDIEDATKDIINENGKNGPITTGLDDNINNAQKERRNESSEVQSEPEFDEFN